MHRNLETISCVTRDFGTEILIEFAILDHSRFIADIGLQILVSNTDCNFYFLFIHPELLLAFFLYYAQVNRKDFLHFVCYTIYNLGFN